MKTSHILGLNARSQLYLSKYNKGWGRGVANSKLRTKKLFRKKGVEVPELYAVFEKPEDVDGFDWESLPASFVLKPDKGFGGEGVVVVRKRGVSPGEWVTTQREVITVGDLKLQVFDILEGLYSLKNVPDKAFIEEYVGRHRIFRKYAYRGTPDIRVIVFNMVPVMAMLRLPTKESRGRANLHQGAVGVGVDIATGITTRAVHYDNVIKHKPGTSRKLNGIRIPRWNEVLGLAVQAQTVSGLGLVAVDIALHPNGKAVVFEINAQPGLKIQLANNAGLRLRLDRIEGIEVISPEHGVRIAKALFASSFSSKVKSEDGVKTISAVEEVTIKGAEKGSKKKVLAKVDTGAWRTSVSQKLAEELDLLRKDNVLWYRKVRSSFGRQRRPVVNLTFWLGGRKMSTPASVAKRMALKYPVIIGRKNLKGLLVDPHLKPKKLRELHENHTKKK